MSKECTIVLPYPPSVNHYKKIGKITRTKLGKIYQQRVNSPRTLRYYQEVWLRVRQEGIKSFGSKAIALEVHVHHPDKRKRDLDGILKVLCDSLQRAQLFDDDCQIEKLLVERKWIEPKGMVIVTILALD